MPTSKAPIRATPRQNARSQFASNPRFLLSQSQRAVRTPRDDLIPSEKDVVDPFSNAPPAPTPARDSASRSRRKEVIEDFESDVDLEQDFYYDQQSTSSNGVDNDIPSCPPPEMAEMDAEIEDLFGPATQHRSKRRRVSVSAPFVSDPAAGAAAPGLSRQRQKTHDFIETSSPDPLPFSPNPNPPSPSLPYRSTPEKQTQKHNSMAATTPRPQPPSPIPATPVTGLSKSSIRNYPRFLPPSSTPRPPPKPTFVLPRSPSPDQRGDPTIPTPFSPSSHPLRRRGRQRSSAPTYLPGGMASEVRTWILEMGSQREQQVHARTMPGVNPGLGGQTHSDGSAGLSMYAFILRIQNVRQSALGSCGPLAFSRGQVIESERGNDMMASLADAQTNDDNDDVTRNVLLMGAPRLCPGELRPSSRVPELRIDDMVGILRGLVWEVGLRGLEDATFEAAVSEHEQTLQNEGGRWLVGMEWEVISSSSK
ncbi:hypothetical protein BDV19DRAFT_236770 [Aspergillus venezuelensis]